MEGDLKKKGNKEKKRETGGLKRRDGRKGR